MTTPVTLKTVAELEAEVERLRGALRRCEWQHRYEGHGYSVFRCPDCGARRDRDGRGHRQTCELAAALGDKDKP